MAEPTAQRIRVTFTVKRADNDRFIIACDPLARIIHQPEKLTREGTFGQDDPRNNHLPGSSRSENKRISLSWHGTNPSHSRTRAADQAQYIRQPPWAWLTIPFSSLILGRA